MASVLEQQERPGLLVLSLRVDDARYSSDRLRVHSVRRGVGVGSGHCNGTVAADLSVGNHLPEVAVPSGKLAGPVTPDCGSDSTPAGVIAASYRVW